MAKEFIENSEESREVFTAASSALGYDLAQLCRTPLRKTEPYGKHAARHPGGKHRRAASP